MPAPKSPARADSAVIVYPRDAAATRARILHAAMDEFAAKGMEARVEDIAEMAGANRRMAYYYFGSKEGLYLAALEETYLELAEVEKSIDVDKLGPLEAIATLVRAKFEHYIRYPRYVEFLKIENMYQARFLKHSKRLDELQGPLVNVIHRVLQRGRAMGVFRKDVDPIELYTSICALGYFVFSNRYTLETVFNADPTSELALRRRRDMIVDMVTAYLTSPSLDPALAPSPERNATKTRRSGIKAQPRPRI